MYGRGWFNRFYDALDVLVDEGIVSISGGAEALDAVPAAGLAYLPTASYREMEAWALPPRPALRLADLEVELGAERMSGPDGALVRGSHWRNFLTKYAESNRLQKKTSALSRLCRERGDPAAARRALIGRAQCNDALWHGVFGGLYLPHLRGALWRQLAIGEGALRAGEALTAEMLDLDMDGADEVWVHSERFSAVVAPARGGSVVDFTDFASGMNFADTLTRRLEAYHVARPHATGAEHPDGGAPEHPRPRGEADDGVAATRGPRRSRDRRGAADRRGRIAGGVRLRGVCAARVMGTNALRAEPRVARWGDARAL